MLTREQLEALRRLGPDGRNRVKAAMAMVSVTQVEVAVGTGHTQSYISRIVNGHYEDLPGETMRRCAVYFGCAIEDLFPAREAVA